ncbi:exported hypothetical protein [uncultured Pleomorphomonas sp.]|uniref:Uncharacterized protein n=1 Tax=uncultured Pleomorphomonas sp. TaxID=442121 RepID=A0A212LE64_9HYPH|nr:exported hypothetical protein [uncultured Pleomorphomonas sp.]
MIRRISPSASWAATATSPALPARSLPAAPRSFFILAALSATVRAPDVSDIPRSFSIVSAVSAMAALTAEAAEAVSFLIFSEVSEPILLAGGSRGGIGFVLSSRMRPESGRAGALTKARPFPTGVCFNNVRLRVGFRRIRNGCKEPERRWRIGGGSISPRSSRCGTHATEGLP